MSTLEATARPRSQRIADPRRIALTGAAVYLHLWILEGAFRKWLPLTDSVMYLARDGLAMGFIVVALILSRRTRKPVHILPLLFLGGTLTASASLAFFQTLYLNLDLAVALVGLRNYIAPLLCVALVSSFSAKSFATLAIRTFVCYTPIQTALILVQVNSPRASFINLQTGGEEAYFTTANDIVRASGTFSAPAGLISFLTIATACVLAAWGRDSRIPKWLLGFCTVTLLVSLATCGSRAAVVASVGLFFAWAVQRILQRPLRGLVELGAFIAVTALLLFFLVQLQPVVVESFRERFQNASQNENTQARVFLSFTGFWNDSYQLLGDGFGSRSTAGIAVGSTYSWVEDDTRRWTAELGLIGLIAVLVRLFTALVTIIVAVFRRTEFPSAQWVFAVLLAQLLLIGSITGNPSSQGAFSIVAAIFLMLLRDRAAETPIGGLK